MEIEDVPDESNKVEMEILDKEEEVTKRKEDSDLEPRLGFEPEVHDQADPILDPRGEGGNQRATPLKELEKIPIDPARPEVEVIIGKSIPKDIQRKLIEFLTESVDVFAYVGTRILAA